jgi:DNA-directed RNA polymerase subunit RPC12/RpoP
MVIVTKPTVKYVARPKPVGTTYRCDQCSTRITLYVRPTEVTHRCKRTQKQRALTAEK